MRTLRNASYLLKESFGFHRRTIDKDARNILIRGKFREQAEQFLLLEYTALRQSMEEVRKYARGLERNVVIALGVSWAWLFHERQNVPKWAWLVPCLFATLALMRAMSNRKFFDDAHQYLCKLELSFLTENEPHGWEHSRARGWTYAGTAAFWLLVIGSAVLVAVYEIWGR